MAATNRLVVSMSARAAESPGSPFRRRAETYSDAGVALDEVLSLTGNVEPVVLRVSCYGGAEGEADFIRGDWLCADHETPRRIPRPVWNYSASSGMWSSGLEWLEAWETCRDARWMLDAAAGAGVSRDALVVASLACVGHASHLADPGEARVDLAMKTAAAWVAGSADSRSVMRAAEGAEAASREVWARAEGRYRETVAASDVARAASFAAQACYAHSGVTLNGRRLSFVAASAASYAAAAMAEVGGSSEEHLAAMADLVRSAIPTADALRAACSAA